jgi:hypothetical protein
MFMFFIVYLSFMKMLAYILCIYIVYLVSLPCVDEDNYSCSSYLEQSSHQANDHDHQHHNTCSPFCVCVCCNVTVVMAKYWVQKKPFRLAQPAFIPFYEKIISVYHSNIWQPPKV